MKLHHFIIYIAVLGFLFPNTIWAAQKSEKPNIIYVLVDNLGFGEIGAYGGGEMRGGETPRIDKLAQEGMRLTNFAPESQCTPSRSALMTGRYAIRSGNHSVTWGETPGGLVAWEKTVADILSDNGYDNYIVGKWHIGESAGRLPTDHGFLSWYGVPRSYADSLWPSDPYYDPKRDGASYVISSEKNGKLVEHELLTVDVKRNIDAEYLKRAKAAMKKSRDAGHPFFLYFNHSLMHLPVIPRDEFKGKSGFGDWADSLLQLDSDVGELLDSIKELGIEDNTIFVFSGDNGPEETLDPSGHRGTSGFFDGSYFAGSEGNLRTPCIVRYPGKIPAGQTSDEIVHITDMFTTLVRWSGSEIPQDRVIDGKDQRAFLEGKEKHSAREGFPYWMGPVMYGVKWQHYKMKLYLQENMWDPRQKLATPHLINLKMDPKERIPAAANLGWVPQHTMKIIADFQKSVKQEPLIPAGAPLDFVPVRHK